MIALVQRVSESSVTVEGDTVGAIDSGLLILLGVHQNDTETQADALAHQCAHLRIFPDTEGRMNHSLLDTEGEALVVPQFTLCGDTSQGHRPSFTDAAPPDRARALYKRFVRELEATLKRPVPTGVFGAMMDVHLVNDGPVTFWLDQPGPTGA
ncbi:MAG: D-aminoacyl-tRNA deacylase [Longimonas sp.]|uniref:D-aminoacyl-tRNA deacylase n=1 Tax=Longimonas sp. TaxID=2039626 RepID=UPI0033454EEA